jgi:aspartyl-tRNA(Asn)/glutamyl-tRNA(Gln) amidotransferase subunit A
MKPFSTIRSLKDRIEKKEITSQEVLNYYVDRFKTYNEKIGAALEVFSSDSIVSSSKKDGSLHGIPGLIKDNIAQQNRGLTCASRILADFTSPYDATASERLKNEGAFLVGRANMDEFAMGSSTETSAFFKTKNPWNLDCVPGGSSGGSAAAVAAGLVPWALGSDTGGSVRQPAAFCGIVGFKPTYGLISRYGLVAYGSSLDQIGIFTHTAYDAAMICSVIAGHDVKDSTTLMVEKTDYTQSLDGSLPDNLTIGIVDNALHAEGMDSEVVAAIEQAIEQYEAMGVKVKRVSLPTLDYAAAAYFILSRAEAASNLARFDGVRYGMRTKDAENLKQVYEKTRHDGFGDEVKARIMVGNYVLSAGHADQFYDGAQKVQRLIRREFIKAFADVDLLIMPTHPAPAFKFGAYADNKLQMDLQDYFTCAMNLAGNPAISIPCGMSKDGLPIGMQLVGPHLSESLLFQAAHAYQEKTAWHEMHPQGF